MNQRGDILAPGLGVVFVGLNPAATAEKSGHNFSAPSNRFWRVLHQAGFTPEEIQPAQDRSILDYRCGLTALVERPTARADQVAIAEFRAAAAAFEAKIRHYAPRFVAFLGKPAYAALAGRREIAWGRQPDPLGGAVVWLLPNPSGRNLAFGLAQLVEAYRELKHAIERG